MFLGPAANRSATIVGSAGRFRITGDVYDVLLDDLREVCEEVVDDLYRVKATS